MSVILGRNVFIYSGASGTDPVIAAAKSCSINIKYDLIEKASSSQQNAKEYISGALEAMLDLGKGSGPLMHNYKLQITILRFPCPSILKYKKSDTYQYKYCKVNLPKESIIAKEINGNISKSCNKRPSSHKKAHARNIIFLIPHHS